MHELIQKLVDWYSQSLATGGYPLIVLLMAIESSLLPLPSELVIPPAVLLASGHGQMTVPGIVLAGAFGSWLGATVMYWASRLAGRPLIVKFGRYVFISPDQVERAERWSARFGGFGVFAARMLPVIRHLIGIPSGIVRFNYLRYSLYTFAGSLIWCAVLARVAAAAGNNQALMSGDLTAITAWLAGAVVVLGALYYLFVYRFARAPDRP